MMNCKQYIFKIASGQLENAGAMEKLQALQHRLMCRACRAFTQNDRQLSSILKGYKAHQFRQEDPTP